MKKTNKKTAKDENRVRKFKAKKASAADLKKLLGGSNPNGRGVCGVLHPDEKL